MLNVLKLEQTDPVCNLLNIPFANYLTISVLGELLRKVEAAQIDASCQPQTLNIYQLEHKRGFARPIKGNEGM